MRDILVSLLFVAVIPFALRRPYIGACLMACIGFLNPHTQAWGFARSIPFVAISVMICCIAMIANRKEIRFKMNTTFVFIYIFLAWGAICTIFAFFPDNAMIELNRFTKIQIVIFLTILIISRIYQIRALVWTMAMSLAFFGVKGAIFTITTGGSDRVYGPPQTFIGGNNEIGLALLMTVPLLYFCYMHAARRWVKNLVLGVIGCCLLSIVFTYSRGAFLGLVCMLIFLWWKSDKKIQLGAVGFIILLAGLPFVPQTVFERISTIETYEQDASAMGRINAWTLAYNLANDRVTGGGYQHTSTLTTQLYAPNPDNMADAHSIYFEVLGEMGWIGLILFFLIHLSNWLAANRLIKRYRKSPEHKWVVDLAKMIQVALIAYYSGGAFLGLAYWDMPYYLMLLVLLLTKVVPQEDTLVVAESNSEPEKPPVPAVAQTPVAVTKTEVPEPPAHETSETRKPIGKGLAPTSPLPKPVGKGL